MEIEIEHSYNEDLSKGNKVFYKKSDSKEYLNPSAVIGQRIKHKSANVNVRSSKDTNS